MTKICYAIALALLVVDPMFACMPYREHFTFGVADIEPALRGTWYATWTRDGHRHSVRFRLRVRDAPRDATSQGFIRSAGACGTRTIVRSASACITATFIPLEMELLDATEGTFEAMLYVGGYSFNGGVLNLSLGHPDAEASATLSKTGEVEQRFSGPALGTATITPKVHLESLWHVNEAF